ncbi:Polyribonucleotide nucleotidyltransferase 1, mitochondrial [Dufourea novaeangliae]|uniref:polyribonucleotide nucleotidyltransferase n=1 Tax=Dufourea novaeangliae TaxID=178035 RepID=A0A154P3A2_DUFNO|nr:Polyribonucleotide nucleotidyltransferase 1, mitochondrial [Dufourea novaeangliae]
MILTAGKYARFASGSIIAKFGNTSVMTTAVKKDVPTDSNVLPLIVDYRQKAAATGRIPTNYFRKELGYTDHEILTSRLIDRSIRPMFDEGYCYETQIVCNLLAADGVNDPDVLSINATSAVLSISDIPWNGPVAAVRIAMIDNEYVINPSRRELQYSILNLIVTCTSKNLIVMIEGSANDILEQDLRKAVRLAAKDCQSIINSIMDLQKRIGKSKAEIPKKAESTRCIADLVREFSEQEICSIFTCYNHDKISRDNAISDLRTRMLDKIVADNPDATADAQKSFARLVKDTFRSLIFKTNKRKILESHHGSAFFQRGQTQVLCTVTLDSIESSIKMDTVSMIASGLKDKNFFLHYEFPPYATNEIGRVNTSGRREVGHGALAEKGLRAVIPKNYPFAIRLTSQVLESNGSSSMASVCGGSMALLDAGVPISSPAAGIAIGLVCKFSDNDSKQIQDYKILTDILGIEDYMGDMDFKIAGTKKGFTALQLDVKIPGIPLKVVMEGINSATQAKNKIIGIMNGVISHPRQNKDHNKPVVENIEVPIYKRTKFLGLGGSNLKKIFIQTGVHIHSQDDNMYSIFAPNQDAMNEAKEIIDQLLTKEAEPTLTFGDIYTAKVVEIRDFGVMISLHPSLSPTLLPNSQLDRRKIHHPSALGLEIGQEIQVKYFGRDPVNGQIRVSRKVLQEPMTQVEDYISTTQKA